MDRMSIDIFKTCFPSAGFPLPSNFALLWRKNDLEKDESSAVNTNHFSVLDNSHKDSPAAQCRDMLYILFHRMATALLF